MLRGGRGGDFPDSRFPLIQSKYLSQYSANTIGRELVNIYIVYTWIQGYRDTIVQDTWIPGFRDTGIHRYHDSRIPGYSDTGYRDTGYRDTSIQGYQDTGIPEYRNTRIQ